MKIKLLDNKKSFAITIICTIMVLAIGISTSIYFSNSNDVGTVQTLSRLGSRGEEVRQIQTKLKGLGYYNSTVDGIYGTRTRDAVISFQKNKGLVADGIAGAKTLSALGIGVSQTISQLGSRGEQVRQIQTKLKELGFYNSSIDGVYGAMTRDAVVAFQKSKGLKADGIAGSQTLSALGIGGGSSSNDSAYNKSDITLLAKVISAEARGESYTGQVAVGAVLLNRVAHASFPDTISGVVYQPGAFSCVYDSNWNEPVSASATRAAQDCMNGQDPTGGAIYYYNPAKTTNAWMKARPITITIGSHVFCK